MARGAKFSATTSAQAKRRLAIATASGCLRFSVSESFPGFRASNMSEPSSPWGFCGPRAYTRRKSGRDRDSTRSTVAPCSAKYRVAMGPAAPEPNSRMLVPAQAPDESDRAVPSRSGACSGPGVAVRALQAGTGPAPSSGAGSVARGRAARPSADRTTANADGNTGMSPTGVNTSRDAICTDSAISLLERAGASMRLVSQAMSYSSVIVWRRKYRATASSIARSVSSVAVVGLYCSQSISVMTGATIPSSATSLVMSWSVGIRALPPRRPNDT